MMLLVKILINDDGDRVDNPRWCLSIVEAGSPNNFCKGEVYGQGEGSAIFETKTVKRGGITCESCLEKIKHIKSVKL